MKTQSCTRSQLDTESEMRTEQEEEKAVKKWSHVHMGLETDRGGCLRVSSQHMSGRKQKITFCVGFK